MDLEGKFSQVTGFTLGPRTEATLVIQALWQNPKMSSTPPALQPTYQHYSLAELFTGRTGLCIFYDRTDSAGEKLSCQIDAVQT